MLWVLMNVDPIEWIVIFMIEMIELHAFMVNLHVLIRKPCLER